MIVAHHRVPADRCNDLTCAGRFTTQESVCRPGAGGHYRALPRAWRCGGAATPGRSLTVGQSAKTMAREVRDGDLRGAVATAGLLPEVRKKKASSSEASEGRRVTCGFPAQLPLFTQRLRSGVLNDAPATFLDFNEPPGTSPFGAAPLWLTWATARRDLLGQREPAVPPRNWATSVETHGRGGGGGTGARPRLWPH